MTYLQRKIVAMKRALNLADDKFSDYKFEEFLSATKTQYINTGVEADKSTRIEVVFQHSGSALSVFENVFGMRSQIGQSDDNSGLYCMLGGTADNVQWAAFHITQSAPKIITDISAKHTIVLDTTDKSCVFDGVKTFSNEQHFSNSATKRNILLFSRNQPSISPENNFNGKIYSAKIWKNNELIRDMKPCTIKVSGQAGMLDVVNGIFYSNAGTGEFYTN